MSLLTYLRLRLLLLGRLLRELGWWRLALVVGLLPLALLQVVSVLGQHPLGRWALPLLAALALLGAHRQRADLRFLAALPGYRTALAAEYFLLGWPLALGLAVLRAWGPALLAAPLLALLAWVPPARADRSTRHRWRSLFRAEAFEWVGGMRPLGWGLWLTLLALAASWRSTALGPALALLGWLLAVMAHYGTPEPLPLLALALRQPGVFLRRRLALGLGYGLLTAAPLLACLGSNRLALLLGLYWLGLLALGVLAKYAFYPHATQLRATQGLVLALGLLGLGHPAFPPLLLVAVGGLAWQSRRRLGEVVRAESLAGS